jgi:hypothetical protein
MIYSASLLKAQFMKLSVINCSLLQFALSLPGSNIIFSKKYRSMISLSLREHFSKFQNLIPKILD